MIFKPEKNPGNFRKKWSVLMTGVRSPLMEKPAFSSLAYLSIWPVMVCGVILYSSIFTGGPQVPDPVKLPHIGKVGHFFVFGLVATLVYRVLAPLFRGKTAFLAAVLLTSLFGAFDEIVQWFNPYRSMQVSDWAVDTAGALLAVSVYVFWPFYRNLLEYRLIPRGRRKNGRVCSRKSNTGVAERDFASR